MIILYILVSLGLVFSLYYIIYIIYCICSIKKYMGDKHFCNYCGRGFIIGNDSKFRYCLYCGRPLTLHYKNPEYKEVDYLSDDLNCIFNDLDSTDILILINLIKRGFYLRVERKDNDEEIVFALDSNLNELTSEEISVINKFELFGFEVYPDGKVETFNNSTDIDLIGFEVEYEDENNV